MQPLGRDDKASIETTIDDEVLKRQAIEFRSTGVQAAAGSRLSVRGELTLVGETRPIAFELVVGDGTLSSRIVVNQTDWGITPYSTLFGALKVADEVEVELDASLEPRAQAETPAYERIRPRGLKPALLELAWISRASVEAHYKLYEGYVNKRNEILGRLAAAPDRAAGAEGRSVVRRRWDQEPRDLLRAPRRRGRRPRRRVRRAGRA